MPAIQMNIVNMAGDISIKVSDVPTAILVMAAGAARRMGQPKQLMDYGGKSLVRHAVEAAHASRAVLVAVIVGAEENAVRAQLQGLPTLLVSNPAWETGMGSTIRAGVEAVRDRPEITSVILTVADAPGLSAETYNRILAAHKASGLPIVASQYSETVGVPVLFERQFFDSLMALPPEQGCKHLILTNAQKVLRLPCPEAAADIDTPEDYRRFTDPA